MSHKKETSVNKYYDIVYPYINMGSWNLATKLHELYPEKAWSTWKRIAIHCKQAHNQKKEFPHFKKIPNVLLLDIETTPLKVWVWQLNHNDYISHENIVEDWVMLSWAGKWLNQPDLFGDVLRPQEAIERDDERIVNSLWKIVEQADIIVAHNGRKFDLKKTNTRFLLNGLKPPSPYQVIDTLLESKKWFGNTSNRLDYLGSILTDRRKIETNFKLWTDCLNGSQESLDYMFKYNKEDVSLLEDVYMRIRGWIKSHPNIGLYVESDKMVCPNCGNDHLIECGSYYTMVSEFNSFRCDNCGAIGRMRKNNLSTKERERILTSNAR